jgi:hypothetical protein
MECLPVAYQVSESNINNVYLADIVTIDISGNPYIINNTNSNISINNEENVEIVEIVQPQLYNNTVYYRNNYNNNCNIQMKKIIIRTLLKVIFIIFIFIFFMYLFIFHNLT